MFRALGSLILCATLSLAKAEPEVGKQGDEAGAPQSEQVNNPEEVPETPPEEIKSDKPAKPPKALPVPSDPVQIYGWMEMVKLGEIGQPLLAKLDTGAKTSSVHAISQTEFQRDGKKWIRFVTSDTMGRDGKRYEIEAPFVRKTYVKEPNGQSQGRNVVRMVFQIGDRRIRADFSLNNRSNMVCPILLGRSTLKVLGWVDPARKNLSEQKLLR